ncbi:tol-pal system-associated acyl-CoA thioesterase [Paracoccus contaminans]|uniref:Tol-pal system-associated acyl-CoA thioesterase n=1 Tax=Paracoccus contaminans TaxID=1945662 RepID=A0A1W6CVL0_9RHOB|nr:tol-pal system-associated acyl-CoA thioesterase [Paracoccus contaminans]ARJ68884.1 tol-pal system-associated acyl-CoA thioesterase [Paracoccus contaminans]
MTHSLPIRVYYEDTDLGQVVYYANYLRFIERGRSEWLRACGVDQGALLAQSGAAFVVRRIEADYLRPARFDDLLDVVTVLRSAAGSRIELDQCVRRAGTELFTARVLLVCVDVALMRPRRLPPAVAAALGN